MKLTTTMFSLVLTSAVLMGVAVSALTWAGDRKASETTERQWLPIPQIYAKLEAAGYSNIEKIEREHGAYEVRATDRQGARARLDVHPQTGEILERGTRQQASGGDDRRARPSANCNERRCRDDLPSKPAAPASAGK